MSYTQREFFDEPPPTLPRRRRRRPPDVPVAAGEHISLPPPLKWAGGKRWQVPHLREYWAGHETRRLVEPFCGGLAVTLGLSPARALANDINASLINFYRWLQRGLTVDVEMDVEMENEKSLYYRQRDRFNALLTKGEGGGAEVRRFSTISIGRALRPLSF